MHYWHHSLYYVKTKNKNSSNKMLPIVSIEPLAQVSKSNMLPLLGTCYLGDL